MSSIIFDLRTKAALGLSSIDTKPSIRATIFNFQNRLAEYEEKTGINLLEKTFDNLTAKQLKDLKIKTDGFRSYSKLYKCVESVESNKVPPEQAGIMLPWVHTMVSNAKRTFAGIHHLMQADYIQNYLDEFCYKVNRRYFGQNIFEILLIASATNRWF